MGTAFITLTTDFGLKDGFVGAMKGVLWSIYPQAQLADISHEIGPQNILEGALVLFRAYSYFPAGTVHLAVVDPGVGTDRRAIAARLGDHYFVGPDNGLFTPVLEVVEKQGGRFEFVHLTNPKYWLPHVSRTFHGRDIFAPAAAHLARGVPLQELGEVIHDPLRLSLPKPEEIEHGWRAHILGIDHFGNLATDLPASAVSAVGNVVFSLRGREVRGLVQSFGQRPPGELVALENSAGFIELAVVNGSAASTLGAKVGDVLEVNIL
jgi:S-adenosyl-L-methionine hydrolase (adenosine-forming)